MRSVGAKTRLSFGPFRILGETPSTSSSHTPPSDRYLLSREGLESPIGKTIGLVSYGLKHAFYGHDAVYGHSCRTEPNLAPTRT